MKEKLCFFAVLAVLTVLCGCPAPGAGIEDPVVDPPEPAPNASALVEVEAVGATVARGGVFDFDTIPAASRALNVTFTIR
ncbi:MAG: hypothetical protein JW902_05465, partial [Syntrophaceae bacterium]|nr:hypothetical protein [Syntrophaceae bacterium]